MDYIQSSMLEGTSSLKGAPHRVLADVRITPILKWPGGKTGELNIILSALPSSIGRYFEPFLGGGAVYFAISDHIPAFVNDKSSDLMEFYKCIYKGEKDFFSALEEILTTWQKLEQFIFQHQDFIMSIYDKYEGNDASRRRIKTDISKFLRGQRHGLLSILGSILDYDHKLFLLETEKNLTNKLIRTYDIEGEAGTFTTEEVLQNIESALKSGFYMYLRSLYNNHEGYEINPYHYSAIFFFIREYSYASMFRFNNQGHFNVPYGGITYNRKDFAGKITAAKQGALLKRLHSTTMEKVDFIDFLHKYNPDQNDFIFMDPPYDTDFSSYDRNTFGKEDHLRLARYLTNECRGKFMLVIKHTDYILSLYNRKNLNIRFFDKKYMWTIKERNNRETVHLMITNY